MRTKELIKVKKTECIENRLDTKKDRDGISNIIYTNAIPHPMMTERSRFFTIIILRYFLTPFSCQY